MPMKHLLEQIIAEIKASARFKWIALGAAWVIFLLAAPGVFIMPSIYESRAQIYVDTTSILRPLLAGIAVSPNTGDQADAVRKALLARPTLEKVVRSTGLNARARTPEQLDALIKSLEKDLVVTGDSRTNTYFISYQDRNPQLTQAVVQVLLDTFVRDALGANRSDTGNARKFLGQQVAEYEGGLPRRSSDSRISRKRTSGSCRTSAVTISRACRPSSPNPTRSAPISPSPRASGRAAPQDHRNRRRGQLACTPALRQGDPGSDFHRRSHPGGAPATR